MRRLWLAVFILAVALVNMGDDHGAVVTLASAQTTTMPWVNVKDKGAKCDGSTNDAAAIQAAINSLPSSGGTVLFPPPTLCAVGSAGISVSSRSNVTLRGGGDHSGIKVLAAGPGFGGYGATTVRLTACHHCQVVGLLIDGNGVASNPIGVKDSTEAVIAGNFLTNAQRTGAVVAMNNTRNRYENNTVWAMLGSSRGLWIGNTPAGEMEYDPQIVGNRITISSATAIGGTATGAEIRGNTLTGGGPNSAGSGIALGSAGGHNYQRSVIAGNVIRGFGYHGIQSDASTDSDWTEAISVVNNVVEENTGSGIYAVRVRHWTIQGNIARDNNIDASGTGPGINIDRAKSVSVMGNTLYNSRLGASPTQTYGIYVVAQVGPLDTQDISIIGNTMYGHVGDGIKVSNSGTGTIDGVTITGNVSCDNGGWGIGVTDVKDGDITHVIVANNVLLGNTSGALRVDPTDAMVSTNQGE